MNRVLTSILLTLLALLASTSESYAQTTLEILQSESIQLSVRTDLEQLQFALNAEVELAIPNSDAHVAFSVGTSGLLMFVVGDEIYIYRSMKKVDGKYVDSPLTGAPNRKQKGCRTPTSNSNSPDITPNGDGKVGPDITGDDGLSVNDNHIDPMFDGETVGRIKVSDLPADIGLSDPDANGHRHIIPKKEMTFEDFQKKLNALPWKDAPPKSDKPGTTEEPSTNNHAEAH